MTNELVVSPPPPELFVPKAELFMPILSKQQVDERAARIADYKANHLKEGVHYGPAGAGKLPPLLKAGAEKLCTLFGCHIVPKLVLSIEDWTGGTYGKPNLFAYTYDCLMLYGGVPIAQASGHCNSRESRYAWRWVSQDQMLGMSTEGLLRRSTDIEDFSYKRRETTGPYGKPEEYYQLIDEAIRNQTAARITKRTQAGRELAAWRIPGMQFRIPNPDIYDVVNTVLKIAMKRAYVSAVLLGVNASDFFSVDTETVEDPDEPKGPPPPSPPPPPPSPPPPPPRRTAAPEAEAPPEVQAIWARMGPATTEERVGEFRQLKQALREKFGDDKGVEKYYAVLAEYGCQHASDFVHRGLTKARRAIAELWAALQEAA
jgi:hypothetical protein